MYWIFLIIFIIAVLTPDIIRDNFFFLSETRVEEIIIFTMGAIAFFFFIKNEQLLIFHKKEKERDQKKIDQTVKDLVESYSYIGEVNRKMDFLMNIALGLSDRSLLSKSKENEIYQSIVSASNFLMKADFTSLRFINVKNYRTKKDFHLEERGRKIGNGELVDMGKNINVKKYEDCLIVASEQKINDIKSYIIICGYSEEEEKSPKNLEILKVFASQALFLYSYSISQAANPH